MTPEQLAFLVRRHPIETTGDHSPREGAVERARRILNRRRLQTFVSCWCGSQHESHAMWRIYCPSSEGIALQTTFDRLEGSMWGQVRLGYVSYNAPRADITPDVEALVMHKRPMFSYEQEVRAVLHSEDYNRDDDSDGLIRGVCIPWNPEALVEAVLVHPEADEWFLDTVARTVAQLTPALSGHVFRSDISRQPPA